MSDESRMKQVLENYITTFNTGDLPGLVALYADNATVEDPVGTDVHSGRDAIEQFYRYAISTGAKLSLDAPIRGSRGNFAAMAFTVSVDYSGHASTLRVIDVMEFDDQAKIVSMRAFWGETDVAQA